MPRYFFDLRDGKGLHRDEFGDDFVDLEEARAHAQAMLPDIVREELPDGERHLIVCEVRDETDRVVYRAELMFRGERL